DRAEYQGPFMPDYVSISDNGHRGAGVGLENIDHCVGNVELGRMDEWVGFYERVMGFREMIHFSDEDISTEYSALMSKVMFGGEGKIKFPLNEPAEGRRKSQIEEYLDFNGGPGVQHVALATTDIVQTVEALQERGVLFLETPAAYYEDVGDRVGEIDESYEDLRRLGILADRDDDGYLLQIFTKTAQDRPTLFFEVIERHGARLVPPRCGLGDLRGRPAAQGLGVVVDAPLPSRLPSRLHGERGRLVPRHRSPGAARRGLEGRRPEDLVGQAVARAATRRR